MATDARQISYELTLDSREPAEFHVLDFEVREALSDDCEVFVRAASASFFDGSKLLGKDGHLAMHYDGEEPRWWNGVIVRCVLRKTPNGANLLEVEIRSRMALLGLGRDNRVFTDASVQEVVTELLTAVKIPAGDQKWSLDKDSPKQQHIFQREESDLAFVQRLLSREGIGYAIHNEEKAAKVLLFDNASSLPPIAGDPELLDRSASNTGTDLVFGLRQKARVRSDTVMMRDYDAKLPGANLDVHAPPDGAGALETYLHPGLYEEASLGKRWAQRALDAIRVGTRSISGGSDCPRLEPGRHFNVASHPRESLNAGYLIVEVLHRGHVEETEGGRRIAYQNSFSALLEDLPFRPPLHPPVQRGPEHVFTTTPSGEEIHVDEFGRVKVRFPWDRSGKKDDTSSGWLRVGQLPLGGSMILPRGDFELLIDYEQGELDRPYIEGHLYNGPSPPPYALPAGATTSSIQTNTTSKGGGANEIRFEDSAGAEEIWLNASRDLTISVDNDASYTVVKNEKYKVGVDAELLVGTDFSARVTSNRKLQVGATQSVNVNGNFSESVGKNLDVSVGGARKVQCGGDHAESTTGTQSRTVGALQSVTGIKSVGRNIVGDSQVTVGAAWMEVVGRSRSSDVKGSRTETVAALKMIRAKQVSLTVTGGLTVNAAAEMVTCGGSRTDAAEGAISITTGGGLSVKAKNITIEGKDTLVMVIGGCIIKLAKGGKILIKAANIDLKGVKALGQAMHKSN